MLRRPFCSTSPVQNSFNTFFTGYVVLFELLNVNDWHVLAGGFVAVTSPLAWVYFISYNVLAVLVLLNVVVAFILETFLLQVCAPLLG